MVLLLPPAFLPLAAPAQAPAQDPMSRLLYADAAHFVASPSAEVRGEAALVLAASGDARNYDAILAVARDPAPEAHLRGLLALGYLGDPGAQNALDTVLEASASRVRPDGVAAAFALGLLPDDHAAAAVAEHLVHFQESSLKRQRDALLAMVTALASRAAATQQTALRQLYKDDSLRDPVVRAALLLALAHVHDGFAAAEVAHLIGSGSVEERRALLAAMAAGTLAPDASLLPQLERVAARDHDAVVRTRALALLTRLRHLPALDLAARAVQGEEPAEIEQATRTMLQLGGAPMRRAIERQIDFLAEPGQAALLRGFSGAMSSEFEAACRQLGADAKAAPQLRTAAALALAHAGVDARALLQERFLAEHDAEALRLLAKALVQCGPEPPALTTLHAGDLPDDLARDSARLLALLLAGHPQVSRFCVEQLQRKDLPAASAASILRALRTSRLGQPAPELSSLLPEPVQALLR